MDPNVSNFTEDRMKTISIVVLSLVGTIATSVSLPAFAESDRDRSGEFPKPKLENLQRQRTIDKKAKQCNIQCITTPCPCTDKSDNPNDGKQPDRRDRKDKFDR